MCTKVEEVKNSNKKKKKNKEMFIKFVQTPPRLYFEEKNYQKKLYMECVHNAEND